MAQIYEQFQNLTNYFAILFQNLTFYSCNLSQTLIFSLKGTCKKYKFYPLGRKLRKTYQNFCGGRSLPVANCILPSGEGLGWGMFLWFLFFAPKK